MVIVHANWMDGTLRLWGESLQAYRALRHAEAAGDAACSRSGWPSDGSATTATLTQATPAHPFAAHSQELMGIFREAGIHAAPLPAQDIPCVFPTQLRLRLPCDQAGPRPSDKLAGFAGEEQLDLLIDPWLGEVEIECLTVPNEIGIFTLLKLEDRSTGGLIEFGHGLRYWIAVARFIVDLLADQRFIPALMQDGSTIRAAWQPWLHDDDARRNVARLLKTMPPIVRAAVNGRGDQPWAILDEALGRLTDATVRSMLNRERFIEAIEDRDSAADPHVTWLSGLLDRQNAVAPPSEASLFLVRDAAQWIGRLDDTGQDRALHLCLKLNEPAVHEADLPAEPSWLLTLHLQSADNPDLLIDAQDVWSGTAAGRLGGARIDPHQELLLAELVRASRVYPKIESVLTERAPAWIPLTVSEAYEFLRDVRPILDESGFGVIVPSWWNQPLGKLGARLHIDAPPEQPVDPLAASGADAHGASGMFGLNSLVNYRWQMAIGDQPLTPEEFQALTRQTAPLVQVRGKWIEFSSQQLAQAREFIEQSPAGQMTLMEALRIAHGAQTRQMSLPVHGLDATGWVENLLGASSQDQRLVQIEQPMGFVGELRPYQKVGLSWLAFLDRFGVGSCLADDMGLGKTIQLIAMLLYEREVPGSTGQVPLSASIGPTLLIVPTSVVSNWVRELQRFAPSLTAHVHHGPERLVGDRFVEVCRERDVIITTYPLVSRDHETLRRVQWHRVALDEAQYIKNPPTKQTTAIRSLQTARRVALTGTPVENRLSELWSIMEFCNPGALGQAGEFRRRFAIPIERHRDPQQAERLRQMVRPFILRRVKTDPNVISDLPECLETKEYATLTPEQAALYQRAVEALLGAVDGSQGMQRRGLVLATLVKLKQICNHPQTAVRSQVSGLGEGDSPSLVPDTDPLTLDDGNLTSLSHRSGKAKRLMVMLEEVLAAGGKALIFTQFRQMGHLLVAMIESDLDREALFLHGGTPAPKRQHLIDRFQADESGAPIFVLSLKAGGLGLNLTAANHVFHFDRWWNPAVEKQATDRAYRIGQTRNVHVHKFICQGTLEERIDQMIEQKTELASNIIGSGEQWLTELSTSQLHELLMLRRSAMEVEP